MIAGPTGRKRNDRKWREGKKKMGIRMIQDNEVSCSANLRGARRGRKTFASDAEEKKRKGVS